MLGIIVGQYPKPKHVDDAHVLRLRHYASMRAVARSKGEGRKAERRRQQIIKVAGLALRAVNPRPRKPPACPLSVRED